MTDARFRLIVLAIVLIMCVGGSIIIWALGRIVPDALLAWDTLIIGLFGGHVYMNGTGSGNGGPGAPKP